MGMFIIYYKSVTSSATVFTGRYWRMKIRKQKQKKYANGKAGTKTFLQTEASTIHTAYIFSPLQHGEHNERSV